MKLPDHKTRSSAPSGRPPQRRRSWSGCCSPDERGRLNFSHGAFDGHRKVIFNLRAAALATGTRLAIMADLSGPKMRIGQLKEEPAELKQGDTLVLTADDIVGDRGRVSVSFKRLPQVVRRGDALYLNDGIIQLEVLSVTGNDVACKVVDGGELALSQGTQPPGIGLGIGAFTERDHECLKFAAREGSTRSASRSSRAAPTSARSARRPRRSTIVPSSSPRSSDRTPWSIRDDILDAADGIMIARGDLGVEVPVERIALIQKELIFQANRRAKPVITATQMLESMTDSRRPTRAEVTDVSNAILDGTDCVMLSGESAIGRYPVDAVAMLSRIAAAVEPHREPVTVQGLFDGVELKGRLKPAHLIAVAVEASIRYASPAAVFVPTRSGATARSLALFRMPVWIAAVSSQQQTCQDLTFPAGSIPFTNRFLRTTGMRMYAVGWRGTR